jgi:hypothetical protein
MIIFGLLGYGHIAPTTTSGKLQFVGYITVGLPLMMVFLARIGNSMAFALKYLYSRIGCRWCRIRRRKTELISNEGSSEVDNINANNVVTDIRNDSGIIIK